jgi:hypothetical protein
MVPDVSPPPDRHPRQHDIGQQQMKAAVVLTTKLQCLLAAGSLQHGITYFLKDLMHQVPNDRFILEQQDGLTGVRRRCRRSFGVGLFDRGLDSRQVNRKFRTLVGSAVHGDMTTVLADNARGSK